MAKFLECDIIHHDCCETCLYNPHNDEVCVICENLPCAFFERPNKNTKFSRKELEDMYKQCMWKPYDDTKEEKCDFCERHTQGDELFEWSSWDGGIGFDYIKNIKYCPLCGKKLQTEDEWRDK